MKNFIFVLLALAMISTACKTKKKTSSGGSNHTSSTFSDDPNRMLVFQHSDRLSPVLEKAQRENKAVFVSFHASWCAPCEVMEDEVFTYRPTYLFLNQNFINYSVDIDTDNGKLLAGIYEVSNLPTVVFLNPQGIVLERKVGMAMSADLSTMGESALAKMK